MEEKHSLFIKTILFLIAIFLTCGFSFVQDLSKSTLQTHEITSRLVPSPRKYSFVLPPGYNKHADPYPVLFFLHGGNRSHKDLQLRYKPVLDRLWKKQEFPAIVVVMVDAKRSRYLDYPDGSQYWEKFYIKEFIPYIRKELNVSTKQKGTFIGGHSMGGLGCLRMAFKYPNMFHGVVAMAPGIMPSLSYKGIKTENRFFISESLMKTWYGDPINEKFWQENNPANIVVNNIQKLKDSKLEIFIEVGNLDWLRLYEGAEFLHNILFNKNIKHEYRLVHKANHIGKTLAPRFKIAMDFVAHMLVQTGT